MMPSLQSAVPVRLSPPPRQSLFRASLILGVSFCLVYGWSVRAMFTADTLGTAEGVLLVLKIAVEMGFSFVAATMFLVAVTYLFVRDDYWPPANEPGAPLPPVGILYLCCNDLDADAVRSLARLRYPGELHLVIHDDAPGGDPKVDRLASLLTVETDATIQVLRRPEKTGGKPGAVNWVLDQVGNQFEHFLICDNDSVARDRDTLTKLVAHMRDPRVAAVQCRNVAQHDAGYCLVNRVLSRATDVFHLFLSMARRFGWCPFVGHNALVRTSAVREVGGMTPGCFADDIDLTVRFNLAGYRVSYAEDVPFGEKHPPSYAAFRARTYKWAYGSMQVLRRHARAVLTTRALTPAEKWGFFQFVGFYTLQSVLLVYVAVFYLLGPLVLSHADFNLPASVVAGTVIPPMIFLPVISYAIRHRRLRELPALLLTCWLGYGATDFPTARGTVDALLRRPRRWVPTNTLTGGSLGPAMLGEAAFGLALLLVPLAFFPLLLLAPLTLVFAAKFLFIPTMTLLYRDGQQVAVATRRPILVRVASVVFALLAIHALSGLAWAQGSRVEVRGDQVFEHDRKLVVRGVHYGPWRPQTGPGRTPYPSRSEIEEDLTIVASTGANTVLVFDPPPHVLECAHARGLRVLYAFWIEWYDFALPAFAARETAIESAVKADCRHPALLGWMLGSEIPPWVVEKRGAANVENALRGLYQRVKAADPDHFVTHGNWPNTRTLDLTFLDVIGFNLYALWPPEVVAQGYETFLRTVVRPLAHGKPLLITEYGANSLEAGLDGQARLVGECWRAIASTGCVGGFAFEFADEWWKNYSNPRLAGAWWDRTEDLADHLRHDDDPEEHYGLVQGDRRPKPAFTALTRAYQHGSTTFVPSLAIVIGLVGLAIGSFIWARIGMRPFRAAAGNAGDAIPAPSALPHRLSAGKP